MQAHTFKRAILAVFLALLAGCGGSTSGGDDGGTGATPGMGGTPPQPTSARLGFFDGGGMFNEGVINATDTTLIAGESSNLSVSIVDAAGAPVTDMVDVFFTSACVGTGLADLQPPIAANSSGTVNVTYTARGCTGTDTVTARTSIDGNNLSATVAIETEQAALGAIQFESVSNPVIGIKGSGTLPEQSVVSFLVTNNAGGPVPNQLVDFLLNTAVGGISLSNDQGTTDANGRVTTTVNSGTVATTVRITATASRNGVTTSAQSSGLAVTTGIPDNDSFSVSAEALNIEGFKLDGETTGITVLAADRFNNPIPDGTSINFVTEGGAIEGSCVTQGGACTVQFRSQDPRPADGRVTILATAIGEETYVDAAPSNGRYDAGEPFTDLPETFRDDDEDGVRGGDEEFLDFNGNGMYDGPGGKFTGLLCADAAACDVAPDNTLNVRRNIVIVLSGSSFFIQITPNPINLNAGPQTVLVSLQDVNGQVPPAGTTIAVETTQGALVGASSVIQLSTTAPGPAVYAFRIEPGDMAGDGTFSVTVTTPNGVISRDFIFVDQTP